MEVSNLSRRQFVIGGAALFAAGALGSITGCSSDSAEGSSNDEQDSSNNGSNAEKDTSPITMVWLPDNSSSDLTTSREAIGAAITAACGREADLMTTTDYNVAIEAIAGGSAQMALLGAEGYVQANTKNNNVLAAFTNSDENGSLDLACYYSRICVRLEDAETYKDGSGYSIENIKDGSFSFVTATSTSGFKIPSADIVNHFDLESSDELLEAGSFFSEVLFGNSHQGSAVNLLSGDADAAAFDDIDVDMYFNLVEGEANTVGAVYEVRDDAEEPFQNVHGEKFVIIGITPVLNAPICFNHDVIDDEDRKAIVDYFCSDVVANDQKIFIDPDDENATGIFKKASEDTCFVEVSDDWYDPIRNLG